MKCKLLTGTYILQANRAAFNQYTVDPTCKLCSVAPATRQHFTGECVFFETESKACRDKLSTSRIITNEHKLYLQDPEFLIQLTLDVSVILGIEETGIKVLGLLGL